MKRVAPLAWLVMALAAAAMAATGYLWTRQQANMARDFGSLLESADPGRRVELAGKMLKDYPWMAREQRSMARVVLASAYGQSGQAELMEQAYLQAIGEDPQNHEALNNLAYEWARRGINLDSALALAKRAVDISRELLPKRKPAGFSDEAWRETVQLVQGNYLDTYGWVLYKRGRMGQALEALEQAAGLAPDPTIDYHYGRALYKSGRADSAIGRLSRAVAAGIEDSAEARPELERIYLERHRSLSGLDKLVAVAREKLAESRAKTMAAEAGKLVGSQAPDFTLEDMGGARRSLSDLRGQVAVLDFWAVWCRPCLKSMPHLQAVHQAFRGRGVEVWGVNLDEPGKLEQAGRYVADQGLEFPMVLGGKMGAGLDQSYQVTGIPTTFVIDKKGVIRFRHIGYRENLDELLAKNIESLLKEP
jgi:peroxiredoxin/Tfp pilus assembly protein PilF